MNRAKIFHFTEAFSAKGIPSIQQTKDSSVLTNPPDLDLLVLKTSTCPDWFTLGMKLNVDFLKLRGIDRHLCGDEAREAMLKLWLQTCTTEERTWQRLFDALEDLGIHHN